MKASGFMSKSWVLGLSETAQWMPRAGLIEAVRAGHDLPIDRLQDRILEKVSTFSGREQEDDITLVVARSRFAN